MGKPNAGLAASRKDVRLLNGLSRSALALVACVATAAALSAQTLPAGTTTIHGKAVTAGGAPVPNVKVMVSATDPRAVETRKIRTHRFQNFAHIRLLFDLWVDDLRASSRRLRARRCARRSVSRI